MPLLDNFKLNIDPAKFQIGEDRSIFLICVLIASFFWLMVKLSDEYSINKDIYLEFAYPANQAFLELPPKKIPTKVEGTGWDLMYDYFLRPYAKLKYELLEERRITLTQSKLLNDINGILSSKGLKLKDFSFDVLAFKLEDKVEKIVPVKLVSKIQIDQQSGYRLVDDISRDPSQVAIVGPVSLVKEYSHWPTETVTIDNPTTTIEQQVLLKRPPEGISLSHKKVKIVVPIEEYTERSFFIPVVIKNAPDSVKIFPKQIKITSIIGLSQYNKISKEQFSLEANFEGIEMDDKRNTVPIKLKVFPKEVKDVFFSPRSAEFFLVKQNDSEGEPSTNEKLSADKETNKKENQTEEE